MAKGGLGQVGDKEGRFNDHRTSNMMFPKKAGPRPCLVEGCSGWEATRAAIRVHF